MSRFRFSSGGLKLNLSLGCADIMQAAARKKNPAVAGYVRASRKAGYSSVGESVTWRISGCVSEGMGIP